jgi:hypothetical protein
MFKKLVRWFADKGFIKLKVVVDNNSYYCPYCLSDLDLSEWESEIYCQVCGTKSYTQE